MERQYFDEHLTARQVLFWSATTRRQLDRWEACVAEVVAHGLQQRQPPGELIWRSEGERHLMLVAAANLDRALDLSGVDVTRPELLRILTEMRNVLEHWDEQLPAFLSADPKPVPILSGKSFAERFPDSIPWSSFAWNGNQGPMILANKIAAGELHEALDQLDAEVLRRWSSMNEYVPKRPPSPWFGGDDPLDRWYPSNAITQRALDSGGSTEAVRDPAQGDVT